MIVPFYQFQELWDSGELRDLPLKLDMTPDAEENSNPIFYKDLTAEAVLGLKERHPETVTLVFDSRLQRLLESRFKDYYHPAYADKISMLRLLLRQFETANALSRGRKTVFRRRFAKSLASLTDKESGRLLIRYNAEITERHLDLLRNRHSDEYVLPYTLSEKGILLVYDSEGYRDNPVLTKLQFQVRKIFHDLRYKRVFATDVRSAFAAWFKAVESHAPKLLVFCGETPSNLFVLRQVKVFDPFAKTLALTPEDLDRDADEIFDRILPKLGSDYAYEALLHDPEDTSKDPLPQGEAVELRERITRLARGFSLREYLEIEWLLLERSQRHVVAPQATHLASVLDNLKISKDAVFTKLLEGYLG